MAGLLFVSTDKIAFCSERSIKLSSPTGKFIRIHYKVSIPISKINKAKESENREKPRQKYIQVITEDDFEFWFMGFLNHQKTLIYLQQEISNTSNLKYLWLCSNHNTEDLRAQEESHDPGLWARVLDYEDENISQQPHGVAITATALMVTYLSLGLLPPRPWLVIVSSVVIATSFVTMQKSLIDVVIMAPLLGS
ncbi:hypothetical protein HAX54_028875 [Datura stramonium]|uniref:GRAM domain-containing protein n=1 Tax=Datura stramonium TaxID=4076 RepID=A0ABS8V714_DATST|nr:hypothetical protein [Datura stramonium]